MEDPRTRNKREIYTMIILASIWFLWAIRRLVSNRNWTKNQTEEIQVYNNIIEETKKLPLPCQQVLNTIDCIITSSSWDSANGIILYRQQLSSERNTLTPTALVSNCDSSKKHIMSLSWLEKSCINNISTQQ